MSTQTSNTQAFGVTDRDAPVAPLAIERRPVGARDVEIDIDYCGICHSDIHYARNDWKNARYPAVPGHEIVGRVRSVGEDVSGFAVGQTVAVGCMVASCRACEPCAEGEEQYCAVGATLTYGSDEEQTGGVTHGGYAERIVVREDFVLTMPEGLDPAAAAPLLCAGITTYSPLKHWGVGPGTKVGVIGLGGLGHMGVKFASAMGAETVMLTTSPEKAGDAERLGADSVLVTTDRGQMKQHLSSFDLLLNTVPVAHDLNGYLGLLARNGVCVIVGAIEPFDGLHSGSLLRNRRRLAGSMIGGIPETQEMLAFCAENDILPDVEMTTPDALNEAWEKVVRGDVRYRYVIDMRGVGEG